MAKKKHREEHENLERWLVSYADFITLLFAFFTVLYALSMTDKSKYQKALESIQRSFQAAGGIFALKGVPFNPFPKNPAPSTQNPTGPSGSVADPTSNAAKLDSVREKIQGIFQKTTGLNLETKDLEVIKSDQGYKIRLGEIALFKQGSDKIKREAIPFLYEVGQRVAKLGANIQIEGHTDVEPDSGFNSNWELSLSRAYHIAQFLVEGTDFPKDKISLAGLGDTNPVADNKTQDGRAKNRRIEISVISPDKGVLDIDW